MSHYALRMRPYYPTDLESLEKWRKSFSDGRLEPHTDGYDARGIETVVCTRPDGTLLASLTGVMSVALGPLIKSPDATPTEILHSIILMTRHLEANASRANARECYIAVPHKLAEYKSIVRRSGFETAAEDCELFSHTL